MATLVAQIPTVTSTILAAPLASPPPRLLLVTSVVLLADLFCIVASVDFSALLPFGFTLLLSSPSCSGHLSALATMP
ncbi:hypothetical protein S83_066502 [Arachis hypogaea]